MTARVLAALAMLLCGFSGVARGQDADPDDEREPTIADTLAAASDTTAATEGAGDEEADGSFLSAVSPKYSMTYEVARQTTGWLQDLSFGARLGALHIDNKTVFDVRNDSGRNEERRDGKNTSTMRLLAIRRLPIVMTMNLGRLSVTRPGDERETDVANLTLSTTSTMDVLGVRHTVNIGSGFERRGDLSAQRTQRSQSTDAGWNAHADWRGAWNPMPSLDINATVNYGIGDKKSTLQVGTAPREENPNRDTNLGVTLSADYRPLQGVNATLSYGDNSRDNAYYLVQAGKGDEERMKNDSRNLTGALEIKPIGDLVLTGRIAATEHALSYQVRRDIASSGSGLSVDGNLKATVLGTRLDGKLSSTKDILEPATSADTDTRSHVFEGQAERPLGARITGSVSWLMRATQVFFSDPDPTLEIQDRDELRTKIQPSLSYRPGDRWTVTASYNRSTSRRVELNQRRASQTRDEEDYSVDFGITFLATTRTRLNQNYSIKALYSEFDFDATQDRLLATQRIVTSVNSALTPRVDVSMEHRFTLQDSGPFRFEEGKRVFARSARSYRQELSADVTYRFLPWARFQGNSRFLRTDDVQEGVGTRVTRRTVEFRAGANVERTLARGLRVSGSVLRVESSVQDAYWNVLSTVSKDF